MPRKIARPDEAPLDIEAVKRDVTQFEGLRDQIEMLTKRQDDIKKRLKGVVETYGEEDDKGNLLLPFDEEIAGVSTLVNQRRVSQSFDESVAEAILAAKGVLEDCQVTRVEIDQDAVMAKYFEGVLTDYEIDKMITKKVSFAFAPQRAKK